MSLICFPFFKRKKTCYACKSFFLLGGWITWNIVSDVYIFTKGKKSINAEKNENIELTHAQVLFVVDYVLCE